MWYDKSPDDVSNSEFVRLTVHSIDKLSNYEVFFFADEDDPKFHPLYRKLIVEIRAHCIKVTIFKDLSRIEKEKDVIIYSPSSKVLFLTICSFGKRTEGFPHVAGPQPFRDRIERSFSSEILTRRREVLNLLRREKIIFDQANQKDHKFNVDLINHTGLEFGGKDLASYLPAIWRYNGRFYQGLGPRGKREIITSPHHFLILSGLYGIVTPDELIQCYSVPLYNDDPVQDVWRDEQFLTKAISDYLARNDIKKLFDFTSIQYYRDLVDWDALKEFNPDVEVLHVFSTLGGGDNALFPFGKLLAEKLILFNEDELLAITPEQQMDDVYFRAIYQQWPDKPGDLSLPQGSTILDIDHIPDSDSKNILKSAEHEACLFTNSAFNPEDAGSTILWHYSKGLERIMHHACAMRIRRALLSHYPTESDLLSALPTYPNSWKNPDAIRTLALSTSKPSGHQLTLGQWPLLYKDLNVFKYSTVSKIIGSFLDDELGIHFKYLVNACIKLKDYRNPATHRKMYSAGEALAIRNSIVNELNEAIRICYRDKNRLLRMSKSHIVEDRIDAVKALQTNREDWSCSILVNLLGDESLTVQQKTIEAIGLLRCPKALEPLVPFSESKEISLKYASMAAIAKIKESNKKKPSP